METTSSTKELKRVLGFGDLLSTAVGQTIGAGIMTLLGAGIALTGRSVPIAFVIAAILTILTTIPFIIVGGTVRVRGGQYTMVGLMAGKRWAGVFVILFIFTNISLAMYGVSFASYFIPFFGVGNTKIVAITVLTLFYVLNIFGIDKFAKFEKIIVVFLCVALGLFVAFGMGKVDPNYMSQDFFINGMMGLMKASALLTFAVSGAVVIVNLSGEAKNPTRDIPIVVIITTLGVAILYGFISIVDAGVFPVSEVAGESLSLVGSAVLPKPVYAFFMVCGAMFALISTLNAQYAWATKPIMQACDDGWLPVKLAKVHPKYKTPIILLTILYVVALVSVISGLDVSVLGNMCCVVGCVPMTIISISMFRIPQLLPTEWNNSKVKVGKGMLLLLTILATIGSVFSLVLNAIQLSTSLLIGNVAMIILAFIFSFWRGSGDKVHMDISHEAN